MKSKIIILLLLLINIAYSQDDKSVTLTVSGSGKTLDEAKTNALRSAIEQTFGAFISTKTEILNDNLVNDEIISVANGNIKSFEILNESKLSNNNWYVNLRTLVSISKLATFVQAKGIVIEIKGGLFAINIKQQILNEQNETKAICEMVKTSDNQLQTAFNYKIKSSEPKSLDSENKNWEINLTVTATTNQNFELITNYCINTLKSLSMTDEEVENYRGLNKKIFYLSISTQGHENFIYLRKQSSIDMLTKLINRWEYYTRSFEVKSGNESTIGKGAGNISPLGSIPSYGDYYSLVMKFWPIGFDVANYYWTDTLSLKQIEQLTGYEVKPTGIRTQLKVDFCK
jgi:hypothetical protein